MSHSFKHSYSVGRFCIVHFVAYIAYHQRKMNNIHTDELTNFRIGNRESFISTTTRPLKLILHFVDHRMHLELLDHTNYNLTHQK